MAPAAIGGVLGAFGVPYAPLIGAGASSAATGLLGYLSPSSFQTPAPAQKAKKPGEEPPDANTVQETLNRAITPKFDMKRFLGTALLLPAVTASAARFGVPLASTALTAAGGALSSLWNSRGGSSGGGLEPGGPKQEVANYDTVFGSIGATVKPELDTSGLSPDVNKIRQIIRSNFIAGRVGNEMSQVIAEGGNQQWVNHVIENAFYSDKITNLSTVVTPPSGRTDGTLTIRFQIADYNLSVGAARTFKLMDSMISNADKFTFNRTVTVDNQRADWILNPPTTMAVDYFHAGAGFGDNRDNSTILYYGNGTEGFGLFHGNGGLLKLKVTSGGLDNIMTVSGAVVGDGKWHNIILTRVGSAANNARWKIWVDGTDFSSESLLQLGIAKVSSRGEKEKR
eukprot:jgi/Mesvir1/1519/Mv14502-RA.1